MLSVKLGSSVSEGTAIHANPRVVSSLAIVSADSPWYRILASLSLQNAGMALDNHGIDDGGPNQWIKVNVTSWLSKIHPSLHERLVMLSDLYA